MPKAVLTTKVDPSYDDLPEERYHFPSRYLNAARAALGDWIVYYEPRRSSAHLSRDPLRTLSAIDPSGNRGRRATCGGATLTGTRRTHAVTRQEVHPAGSPVPQACP